MLPITRDGNSQKNQRSDLKTSELPIAYTRRGVGPGPHWLTLAAFGHPDSGRLASGRSCEEANSHRLRFD